MLILRSYRTRHSKIKEEYKFDKIKDAFDEGKIPPQLEFLFGADNDNFLLTGNFLSLSENNNELASFLCSDLGKNIMTNNGLSIHIETGDILYNDFKTKQNFYNFLLDQQDELKQFIPKRNSYYHSFRKYTRSYFPPFSLEEIDKLDLLSNKNAKYLLYKFNDWIESMGAEKKLIRHTRKLGRRSVFKKYRKKISIS